MAENTRKNTFVIILHCGLQWFSHGALALYTWRGDGVPIFEALELQFCHPQIQDSPQYVWIRLSFWQAVAAPALGRAAVGLHLQTKIWHFGQAFATWWTCFCGPCQAKAGSGPIFGNFFWPLSRRILFWNDPDFGTILVLFFKPGTLPGNGFLPFARWPRSASWVKINAFCSADDIPTGSSLLWIWVPPMSTNIKVLCHLWNCRRMQSTLQRYPSRRLEAGFFGRLQRGLKRFEGGLKGAWRGLQEGLKGASRGLEGGFKGAWNLQRWRGLRGGLKGAWPWRGLKGGFKGAWSLQRWRGLWRGLKGASRVVADIPCSKCYGMHCFATYFTHVQTCNVTRVQSATEWTASVHTLHMSKPVM